MAVTAQTPQNQYVGNGSNLVFPYTFRILETTQIAVYVDGVEQTQGVNYTVSGAGDSEGGNITFMFAPAEDALITILRVTALVRTTDYINGGVITAETLDFDQDYQTLVVQEVASRAISKNVTLNFDAQGVRIENVGTPVGGTDAANKDYVDATFLDTQQLVNTINVDTQALSDAVDQAEASAEAAAQSALDAVALAQAAGIANVQDQVDLAEQYKDDAQDAASAAILAQIGAEAAQAVAEAIVDFDPNTMMPKTGGTFTGPINVPAGATGNQAPRAADIPALLGITGVVAYFPCTTAPSGWLACDGSAVSRTTYAALWAFAQTSGNLHEQVNKSAALAGFGTGNGSTTFTLPDLRGDFIRCWHQGATSRDPDRSYIWQREVSQNLSHGHSAAMGDAGTHSHITRLRTTAAATSPNNVTAYQVGTGYNKYSENAGNHSHALTIYGSGGSEARPNNSTLLACIKT